MAKRTTPAAAQPAAESLSGLSAAHDLWPPAVDPDAALSVALPTAPPSDTPYMDANGFDPAAYEWVPVLRRRRPDGWTPDKQRAFIECLADCGSVAEAARAVDMSESSCYKLRRSPDAIGFDHAWTAAIDAASKKLIDVAFQRAVVGYDDPVLGDDGQPIYMRTRLSEKMLMFLLRAYMPERFGAAAHERRTHGEGSGEAIPAVAQAIAAMLPEPPASPHTLMDPAELDVALEVADLCEGDLPAFRK